MTSSALAPTNQAAHNLDVCTDKEGCGLMSERIALNVHICGASRVASTQSTPASRSPGHMPPRRQLIETASRPRRVAAQTIQHP